jgi:hypothetical protein
MFACAKILNYNIHEISQWLCQNLLILYVCITQCSSKHLTTRNINVQMFSQSQWQFDFFFIKLELHAIEWGEIYCIPEIFLNCSTCKFYIYRVKLTFEIFSAGLYKRHVPCIYLLFVYRQTHDKMMSGNFHQCQANFCQLL